MGISFILLAGGEPFMRADVLEKAAKHSGIFFPVFTNGTMIGESELNFLDKSRNIVPVLSIEGSQTKTDARRGNGIYLRLIDTMEKLCKNGILYGASVTVTTENICEVTGREFLYELQSRGCKAVIYVEYVPADGVSASLAPTDADRETMNRRLKELRQKADSMVYISFPGDEEKMGGCLAAGRGMFSYQPKRRSRTLPLFSFF